MRQTVFKYTLNFMLPMITVLSCNTDNQILNNTDLIFTNSYRLPVPSYSYFDTDSAEYTVSGDTNYFSALPDTFDHNPVFRWDTFNIKIMCCAIFLKPIHVNNGIITNPEDMIWQWHSGMEKGHIGNVQYSEGKSVINDTIDYVNDASPLKTNDYFWGVWGWNRAGTDVIYSSREMRFYVSK